MANYDPQNFKSVILYMRNEFGASVFRDASRMYATFCELSPKLESYGNIMRQLIERGALAELEAASGDSTRQNKAMMKARDILENKLLLSVDRAGDFLGVLGSMYGAPPPKRSKPKQSAKKKPSAKRIQWGECGCDGYSVRYERCENGLLAFSGAGPIRNFKFGERRDGTQWCNTPWWNYRKAISRVEIPGGVTGIGNFAFSACSELTSVSIPDSVAYIGEGAFYGCLGLTSVVIPASVTKIEEAAFADCAGLTNVVIPDSVTKIGNCSGFDVYYAKDDLKSFYTGVFQNCTGLTSVVIPDSVTQTGKYTFFGCAGLTSVVIPDSVTKIDVGTFADCAGLTSVVIPDSVTYIGRMAFDGCAGLTSVVIPDSVTTIKESAFHGCDKLRNVSIPAKTQISDNAFPDTVHIERRA